MDSVAPPAAITATSVIGFPPSATLAAIETILTEWQQVDQERAAWNITHHQLQTRISELQQCLADRDTAAAVLQKKIAILEYGVKHERAMRMAVNQQQQQRPIDEDKENSKQQQQSQYQRQRNKEKELLIHKQDEKEAPPLLFPITDHRDSHIHIIPIKSLHSDSSHRGKRSHTITNGHYFTLPSKLPPTSLITPASLPIWKDYIQHEAAITHINIAEHQQREQLASTSTPTLPPATPTPSPLPKHSPTKHTPPRPPTLPSPPPPPGAPSLPSASASPSQVSPLVGSGMSKDGGGVGVAAAGGKKKHISFAVNEEEEGEEKGEEAAARPSIKNTNMFTPPTEEEVKAMAKAKSPTTDTSHSPTPSSSSPSPTAPSSSSSAVSSPSFTASLLTASAAFTFKALKPKLSLRNHVDAVRVVAFDQSSAASGCGATHGFVLGSGSEDGTAKLWNLSAPLAASVSSGKKTAAKAVEPFFTFRAHQGPVVAMVVNAEAGVCVTSGMDRVVNVWDYPALDSDAFAAAGKCGSNRRAALPHTQPVWSTALGHNAGTKLLACACANGAVYLWNVDTLSAAASAPQPLHAISLSSTAAPGAVPTSLTFIGCQQLAAGYSSGEVALIDVETGVVTQRMSDSAGSSSGGRSPHITQILYHPHHRTVYSAHADHCIRVFDPLSATSSTLATSCINAHGDCVTSISLHVQSGWLASSGHDQTIRLWDSSVGHRMLQTLEPHQTHKTKYEEAIHSVGWSGEGNILASGGADAIVKVYV